MRAAGSSASDKELGLARDDVFSVGIGVAMTESIAHCDVVLPAATHFEYPDLYAAYGQHWMQQAEPVKPFQQPGNALDLGKLESVN